MVGISRVFDHHSLNFFFNLVCIRGLFVPICLYYDIIMGLDVTLHGGHTVCDGYSEIFLKTKVYVQHWGKIDLNY